MSEESNSFNEELVKRAAEQFEEMDKGEQMTVEELLINQGSLMSPSTAPVNEPEKTESELEFFRDFLPSDERTEEKSILSGEQARALTQMEMWPRLLGVDDDEFESNINQFIEQFERRQVSVGGLGRRQATDILSGMMERGMKDEDSSFGKFFQADEE